MPATITPLASNVGNKTGRDIINYTVAAAAGTTITRIEERVAGQAVNVFTNPASLSRTFTIPQATFDGLRFFHRHTLDVVVTDSAGQTATATYFFTKSLATNASLLEAVKAVEDARVLLNDKRSTISSLVGIGAAGSFDQIINQLVNGSSIRKVAEGTATSSNGELSFSTYANTAVSRPYLTVSGIGFAPQMVVISTGEYVMTVVNLRNPKQGGFHLITYAGSGATYIRLTGNAYMTSSGFRLPVHAADTNFKWEAYS